MDRPLDHIITDLQAKLPYVPITTAQTQLPQWQAYYGQRAMLVVARGLIEHPTRTQVARDIAMIAVRAMLTPFCKYFNVPMEVE